tara:strand:+ start:5176 stop:5499 length:324 start_codon:yes stop_codon:yes gene_type:complete
MADQTNTPRNGFSSLLGRAATDRRAFCSARRSLSSHSPARGSAEEAAPGQAHIPSDRARRFFLREMERAHMIATTPPGVWPQSLVALAEKALRDHPGWNVTHMEDAR